MFAKTDSPGASRHVSTPIERLEVRALLAVTPQLVEVPISAAAIAADPALANFRSFDLRVVLTPGDRFNVAAFDAELSAGQFYRIGNQATTEPATWPVFPQHEFATFVCVQNFAVPTSGILPYLDNSPVFSADRFHPVWGQLGGSPATFSEFTIARITVSNDAVGSIHGEVRSIDQPNQSVYFVGSTPLNTAPVALARGSIRSNSGSGLAGWTVFGDRDRDGVLDADEPRTTSVAGNYALVAPAGSYDIRAIPQDGLTVPVQPPQGFYAVTLAAGQIDATLSFVFAAPGSATIEGTTFENNTLTIGGTGTLAGVTVYLDLNNNSELDGGEPSHITLANGRYSFAVVPGVHVVRTIAPSANYAPLVGNGSASVTVQNGQIANQNFTFHRVDVAAIRGKVRRDTISGTGFPGWTVYLDANNNSQLDTGESSTTTAADGSYQFIVSPGAHTVRQVLQTGYELLLPASGSHALSIAGGAALLDNDFVVRLIQVFGRISGSVSQPSHHVAPGGNTALANWTIYLDADNDNVLDSGERRVTTDSAGNYTFGDLAAGIYVVRVKKPSGWRYMSNSTDNHIVVVAPGQNVSGRDYVYTQRIMIAGVVFDDLNGNGVKNSGEHGVRGRRVWVDLNNDGLIDSNEPGGYVGQKGVWGFEDLVAGTYTVRVEEISNWQNVGTGAFTVTLASGKVKVAVPFGQQKITAPQAAALPRPRPIGELSPEMDLTAQWALL